MRQASSSVSVGSTFGTGSGPPLLRPEASVRPRHLRHREVQRYQRQRQQQEGGRAVERSGGVHGCGGTGCARRSRAPARVARREDRVVGLPEQEREVEEDEQHAEHPERVVAAVLQAVVEAVHHRHRVDADHVDERQRRRPRTSGSQTSARQATIGAISGSTIPRYAHRLASGCFRQMKRADDQRLARPAPLPAQLLAQEQRGSGRARSCG